MQPLSKVSVSKMQNALQTLPLVAQPKALEGAQSLLLLHMLRQLPPTHLKLPPQVDGALAAQLPAWSQELFCTWVVDEQVEPQVTLLSA